jgi:type II secretory pathway component PulF
VNGAVLVFAVPQFKPIFDKFEKDGDLPDLTRWMIALFQINQIGYCVPLFAVVAAFLAFDAGIGAILRQPKHGKSLIWFWFLAACCVLVGLFLLMVCGLLLPVFKMSGAVG